MLRQKSTGFLALCRTVDYESSHLLVPPTLGGTTLVIFVTPKCQSCNNLMIGVRTLSRQHLTISWAIVAFSDIAECREFRRRHRLQDILFCHAPDSVWDKLKLRSSPYAVLLDPEGRVISKGLVNHIEHLESLIAAIDADANPQPEGVRS